MRVKTKKLVLDGYGSFLGREKGCFIIRDRNSNVEKYPLFENEIGEIQIKSGNLVSSGALATCGFWGIDCLILTQRGNPVAILKSLDDDSHVKTRIFQYRASENHRGAEIARTLVIAKVKGYDKVLCKYSLKQIGFVKDDVNSFDADDIKTLRRKLMGYESKYSRRYFSQVFQLFDESFRPLGRKTFKAYDGLNNLFNLAYELLRWKVHIALIKAKLEPCLGFLHSLQYGKPSLDCDFQELYRYLIDDFIIQYCRDLKKKDFIFKTEKHANKKGKRKYLNDVKTRSFMKKLNAHFESMVEIPRIKVGRRQEIETLINEEALLFAKYLRNERKTWKPRIASLPL